MVEKEKEGRVVRRSKSAKESKSSSSRKDPPPSPKKEGRRRRSRSRDKGGKKTPSRKDGGRSNSGGKYSGRKDPDGKISSQERDKNSSGDRRRSRSKDGPRSRSPGDASRSESTDHKRNQRRSVSREKKDRNRSRSGSRTRKDGSSSEKVRNRSRSREGSKEERSKSIDRSSNERERPASTDSVLSPSSRRRHILKSDSSKRSASYIKNKQEKDKSDVRKSSVLGSLHAFLEDDQAATPRLKDAEDRSVMSSVSKIHRRKSRSSLSGSASVFGGQVSSRDQVRERRRSRSSSTGPLDDAKVGEERKESRREKGSTRSRTPSSRARHSYFNQERNAAGFDSPASSATQPSDRPIEIKSPRRAQHRMSLVSGADVPPGFPVAAIDKNPTAVDSNLEVTGHVSEPTMLESTAKIRERQLQRLTQMERADSTGSLGAVEGRSTLRRRRSLKPMGTKALPQRSLSDSRANERKKMHLSSSSGMNHEDEKTSRLESLSSQLEKVETSTPIRRLNRSGSGRSVSSAPALSEKHRRGASARRKPRPSSSAKKDPDPQLTADETESAEETILNLPSDEAPHEGTEALNDFNSSTGSLDPSLLCKKSHAVKQVSSIHELYYHDNAENDGSGIEGELELNDGSTQATQESSSDSYKQTQGPSIVVFDTEQLQKSRPVGPGHLSPHSSSLSGTSDSTRSPGILKRQSGQAGSPPSNLDYRVSWVELPLTAPGALLVKSTDTNGTDERETMTPADLILTMHDFSDHSQLECAMSSARMQKNGSKPDSKSKKNPSLDAALKNDKSKKKKGSADERTVGTTATSTSESTAKAGNRSIANTNGSRRGGRESTVDRHPPLNITRSDSTNRSGRSGRSVASSPGPHRSMAGDGDSRRSLTSEDASERRPRRRSSIGSLKISIGSMNSAGTDDQSESKRRPVSRSSSTRRAGSKIRYQPKDGDSRNVDGFGAAESISVSTTPVSKKKSYLNRRQMTKQQKEDSQSTKNSIFNSLDKFLEKMGDAKEDIPAEDNRSVKSEGRLKARQRVVRLRKVTDDKDDDRSVASAPSMNRRRGALRRSTKAER